MKKTTNDLAIFGGAPAFGETLHVGRPNVGDRERLLARFNDILDNRWFTNHGPYVGEQESRLAEMLGVEHCIAMCNATKFFNTFEGGAVTTNDGELAKRIRLMHNFGFAGLMLPVTERLVEQVMTVPTGAAVSADDVGRICDIFRFALSNGAEVRRRLSA